MPCGSAPAAPTCCSAATSWSAPAPMRWPSSSRAPRAAIVNTHETITGEFTRHPDLAFPSHTLRLSIEAAAGARCLRLRRSQPSSPPALMGDSIATNLFMLGYAYQKGLIPIGHEALERAIELNGTAVPMNSAPSAGAAAPPPIAPRSRRWSRRQPTMSCRSRARRRPLDEIVASRVEASHRLPERGARRALQGAGRSRARGRAAGYARPDRARRGGGAQLRQAAGLQGRVRGGAAVHRRPPSRPSSPASSRATTGSSSTSPRRCSPSATPRPAIC